MASGEGRRRHHHDLVPLAALISRELKIEKMEKPSVRYGCAAQPRKGEDYFLLETDCQRVPGNPSTSFSVFAVFDGHNGNAAAIFTKENLLNHVLGAMPHCLGREEWLQALPRALVAGFVKTDKEFQSRGETSGTTVTFVIVDGWTVTVASVGDSRCILDAQGGAVSVLTVDHRLEENVEERERVTASGGEVGRLSIVGGAEIGPLRCWPGGLCLSRSIGDMDVGEFIVPIPYVKQVKLSNAGGRLIIASDGIWDALLSEKAAISCRGLPAELAAKQVVKEALRTRGLKDDTTCIVVDIIPPDNSLPPSPPPKKQNKLRAFIFRKRSRDSANKLAKKLSTVGIVEELFEEGSAMLAESRPSNRRIQCAMQFDNSMICGRPTDPILTMMDHPILPSTAVGHQIQPSIAVDHPMQPTFPVGYLTQLGTTRCNHQSLCDDDPSVASIMPISSCSNNWEGLYPSGQTSYQTPYSYDTGLRPLDDINFSSSSINVAQPSMFYAGKFKSDELPYQHSVEGAVYFLE